VIHGDWNHLISNSLPLFVSLLSIFYFYKDAALKVFLFVYVLTGVLVWTAGREVWHIGASGIVYGFITFLFFSGIFRRDNRSIALALVVTFLYGGMVWGILPGWKGISWESHLFGAITGVAAAFIFRKSDPQKKYEWEDESESDESEVPFDGNKL
jgi:membrane associated rhomboid family serine protease